MNAFKPFFKRHSSTILTAIGAAGVVITTASAIHATPKALMLIEQAKLEKVDDENPITDYHPILTPFEIVEATWRCYIPSILIGSATIACIFGANALNRKQQATIASAYIFLERSYRQYKNKVIELYGKDTDRKVVESIAKDKYESEERKPSGTDTLLFFEEHYGEYFERTMLEVQDAEYQLNRKLAQEGEASLNDFFRFLSLNETDNGKILGWSQEMICDFYHPTWIDFEHQLAIMDDGMECYIINILIPPKFDYDVPF